MKQARTNDDLFLFICSGSAAPVRLESPKLRDKPSSTGVKSNMSEAPPLPPAEGGVAAREADTPITEEEEGGTDNSIFLQTAAYLLDVHALKFAEMALAHELTSSTSTRGGAKSTPAYLVTEARLHMHREKYQEAKACLKKALTIDIQDSNAWALLGHAQYQLGEWAESQDAYERTLGYITPPVNVHILYTRLANIYLKQEKVSALRFKVQETA